MAHLKKEKAPLLHSENIDLESLYTGVQEFSKIFEKENIFIRDVVNCIAKNNIFESPDNFVKSDAEKKSESEIDGFVGWDEFLKCDFKELVQFFAYISGQTNFATQQGVKGDEFDRVMLILDDSNVDGKLFSYEKIFWIKKIE